MWSNERFSIINTTMCSIWSKLGCMGLSCLVLLVVLQRLYDFVRGTRPQPDNDPRQWYAEVADVVGALACVENIQADDARDRHSEEHAGVNADDPAPWIVAEVGQES